MIKQITIESVRQVSHGLACQRMEWNEPIPDFDTRFPNILESCVSTPFQSLQGKDAYPGLILKASILFYLLIKNHPFQNGNKRIAVTTLLIFLYLNNKWIDVDETELYNFAVWVASSPPKLKRSVVKAIEEFIEKHISSY